MIFKGFGFNAYDYLNKELENRCNGKAFQLNLSEETGLKHSINWCIKKYDNFGTGKFET